MVKVVLDTDIGTDIDDALALAYLLAEPRCNLLGITTVTGEAHKRAMLASAICKVAKRDVPIYPGAEVPLVIAQGQPVAQQAAALGNWEHDTAFPRGEAVWFLRETIRRHPGEVILLAIGPLTNVALLFIVDPDLPALLQGLVLMCGDFAENVPPGARPEWNARGDAHATHIVYRTPVAMHRSLGLNVTRRVTMNAQEARRALRAPLLRPVLDFAEIWFQQREIITFHDPLAAVSIFDPDVCRFDRGLVSVDLSESPAQGTTYWRPGGENARHEVAVDVDPQRFFSRFFAPFA